MILRLATLEDVPQIMALIKNVIPLMHSGGNFQWGDDYPTSEVFIRDITFSQLWVSEFKNQVVGLAAITTEQDPEYSETGWNIEDKAIVTHRLAVDPDCQGMGIARALMNQAEQIATTSGIKILRIDTNSENAATNALFPKLGYQFSGEISFPRRLGLRFYCYQKLL